MKYDRVMIFGTFDLFHAGHQFFIDEALLLGNDLQVVIARDKNVVRIKKQKPVEEEQLRLALVKDYLSSRGEVVLGDFNDFLQPVRDYQPDIIALGYDQQKEISSLKKELASSNLFPKIVRLTAFCPDFFKSSKIRAAMASS